MTETRWQCPDCPELVYPYCDFCPHCGAARPVGADFPARLERFNAHVIPKLTVATAGDKHGFLAPVDWKARHAAIKAERTGK